MRRLFCVLAIAAGCFFLLQTLASAHELREGRTTWSHTADQLAGYGLPYKFPDRWDVHCSDKPRVDPYFFPLSESCRGEDAAGIAHFVLYAAAEEREQKRIPDDFLEHLGHVMGMYVLGQPDVSSGTLEAQSEYHGTFLFPTSAASETLKVLKYSVSVRGTVTRTSGEDVRIDHTMNAAFALFKRDVEYMVRRALRPTIWEVRPVYFVLAVHNRGITGSVGEETVALVLALGVGN